MSLKTLESRDVVHASPRTTVLDAVRIMHDQEVSSVAVMEADRLCGIFTLRDVAGKVVLVNRDPAQTTMADVMTRDLISVKTSTKVGEAVRIMLRNHIHHLPILSEEGKLLRMVSLQLLLRATIEDLEDEVSSLDAYLSCDSPGG